MKTNDITIGGEYAYRQRSWMSIRKVKVLEAVEIQPATRKAPAVKGWLIEFLDDSSYGYGKAATTHATSRQIVTDWETFKAGEKAEREKRAAQQAAEMSARDAEIAAAADLNLIFHRRGVDATATQIMHLNATQLLTIIQQFETGLLKALRENS